MPNSNSQLSESVAQILAAPRPATPWRDGDKIPWNDPELSQRLLEVHLDPATPLASRPPEVITEHVTWLRTLASGHFPEEQAPRLLDLGCGPGLYCQELARQGWHTVGVDFGPASIEYARREAAREDLGNCVYLERDLKALRPEELADQAPFELVTFWFGELNAFQPDQAQKILSMAATLLCPGGLLVLEPQPWDSFQQESWTEWQACQSSLWSDSPHLWLQEHLWNEQARAEIIVHWIIHGQTGQIQRHAQCHQAYEREELDSMLEAAALEVAREFPPISGKVGGAEFPVLVARKP